MEEQAKQSKKSWLGVKIVTILAFFIVAVCAGFFYFKYCFVYSEGVEAGTLNYIEKKGFVFKTYEGRMILEGYKGKAGSTIVSNEFIFSVADSSVAATLMRCSGKHVELHYERHKGTLPWRGDSEFVVDSVLSAQ